MRTLLYFCALMTLFPQSSFKSDQRKYERVKTAYDEKESVVKQYFTEKKLAYPGFNLFLRLFKREMKVEVWVKEKNKEAFSLLTTYDFCSTSGGLGPKRKEGDHQIPEGIYQVNHFNPVSNFFLSLGVSYPNASDKIFGDKKHPGGAIYIHGNCVTVGCVPITDDKIKELYVLAVEAKQNGQGNIPIHIFPSQLTESGFLSLEKEYAAYPGYISLWRNLKAIYQDFEASKKLKAVKIDSKGRYSF